MRRRTLRKYGRKNKKTDLPITADNMECRFFGVSPTDDFVERMTFSVLKGNGLLFVLLFTVNFLMITEGHFI